MKKQFYFIGIFILIYSNYLNAQTINIDYSKEYQTIVGFGGFGAKKVWWDSAPYYDNEYLTTTMDNMGSTIFRTQLYFDFEQSNDNNDPNVLDESKLNFGLNSDNGKQFTFLKAAADKGAKIIVSVWTPPSWMKDFSDPTTIPDECYNCWNCPKPWTYPIPESRKMCGGVLRADMYAEYAEYLVAYTKIVKRETGIDIYALSIQNEPLFANPFEAAVLRPANYRNALKVVAERFKKEGLKTKFFGPEHMGEYSWGGNRDYVNELFNRSTVGKDHLDFFAVHGYSDGVANDFGTDQGWTNLYENVTKLNGKPLWMTETGNNVENIFEEGFKFGIAMHRALKFGRIEGWVFWGMEGNAVQGNTLTHTGASMKNYFKYISEGSKGIEVSTTDKELLVTAFKKVNGLTVVIINNGASDKTVTLNTGTSPVPATFDVYRYSASEMSVPKGTVRDNSFALPRKSITTLVYNGPITSVEEIASNETLNIYPTQIQNNMLYIDYTGNGHINNISIISAEGKVVQNVLQNFKDKNAIDVSNIEKGFYLVKISTTSGYKTYKINIL